MLADSFIPANIQLRDYQSVLVRNSLDALVRHRAVMVQGVTGCGKTVMFLEIFRRCLNKGYAAMMVAHREELIFQCRDKLYNGYGVIPGIIMSGYRPMYHLPIQVASVQTLVRREKPKNIKLIVVDEAHHCTAKSYRNILAAYPDAKVLGFTATPVRTNGEGFDDIFGELVQGPPIKWFEENGFLCPARVFINPIDHRQLADITITAGDYNEGQLAKFMSTPQRIRDVVENYKLRAMGKRNCVFAVDIAHSKQLAAAFNLAGIPAVHVDGTTEKGLRRRMFDDFTKGTVKVLCNVGIATEGVDIPAIECVQAARPTKALWMYLQMTGRGSRLSPGKDHYILLDHANWLAEHGRPNSERKWTLKGKKKTGNTTKVRQFALRFPDGSTRMMSTPELSDLSNLGTGVELVEVTENYRVNEFETKMRVATNRDFNKYWAFCKWLEGLDDDEPPSTMELAYVRSRLNYRPGWEQAMQEKLARAQLANGTFKAVLRQNQTA